MKNENKIDIEKGIIKVVWIEKSNRMLYSKMFDSISEALKFSKNKKMYLISKLIKRKGLEFRWRVLNYGKAKNLFKIIKYEKSLDKF